MHTRIVIAKYRYTKLEPYINNEAKLSEITPANLVCSIISKAIDFDYIPSESYNIITNDSKNVFIECPTELFSALLTKAMQIRGIQSMCTSALEAHFLPCKLTEPNPYTAIPIRLSNQNIEHLAFVKTMYGDSGTGVRKILSEAVGHDTTCSVYPETTYGTEHVNIWADTELVKKLKATCSPGLVYSVYISQLIRAAVLARVKQARRERRLL
jgi:hypothetical protein